MHYTYEYQAVVDVPPGSVAVILTREEIDSLLQVLNSYDDGWPSLASAIGKLTAAVKEAK